MKNFWYGTTLGSITIILAILGCEMETPESIQQNQSARLESGELIKTTGVILKIEPDVSAYNYVWFYWQNGNVVRFYVNDGQIIPTRKTVIVYVTSNGRVEKIEEVPE